MSQFMGRKNAKVQKRKHDLQQQVLIHLKKSGASLYAPLSVRFDPKHTPEIQPLLRGLREYGYIDVSAEQMVTITTFGLQQLES
jgi:hypothetical protein